MTLQEAARVALGIQDACNLSGVVFEWEKVMKLLCEISHEQNKGTDWRNTHPINVLFASKVASLTRYDDDNYYKAYEACVKLTRA